MNFVFVQGDAGESNSCNWLLHIPVMVLKRHGHQAQVVDRYSFSLAVNSDGAVIKDADVIVVERIAYGNVRRAIEYWAPRIPTIYRFDDHYKAAPDYSTAFQFWHKNMSENPPAGPIFTPTPMLRQLEETFHAATAISAPSKYLLAEYGKSRAAKKKIFIPNRHDPTHPMWQVPAMLSHPGEIWLGWGGSWNHVESWIGSGILPALVEVTKRHSNVRLAVACGNGAVLKTIQDSGINTEQVIVLPWLPFELAPATLKLFDIGLAPLAGEYDKGRSWIKGLEYAHLGIPWVGSSFGDVYKETEGGVLVKNTESSWEKAIEMAIKGWPANGQDWAAEQAIDEHIDEYERLGEL